MQNAYASNGGMGILRGYRNHLMSGGVVWVSAESCNSRCKAIDAMCRSALLLPVGAAAGCAGGGKHIWQHCAIDCGRWMYIHSIFVLFTAVISTAV